MDGVAHYAGASWKWLEVALGRGNLGRMWCGKTFPNSRALGSTAGHPKCVGKAQTVNKVDKPP